MPEIHVFVLGGCHAQHLGVVLTCHPRRLVLAMFHVLCCHFHSGVPGLPLVSACGWHNLQRRPNQHQVLAATSAAQMTVVHNFGTL